MAPVGDIGLGVNQYDFITIILRVFLIVKQKIGGVSGS